MRDIKFRAWDKNELKMIDADSFYFSDEFEPFVDSVRSAHEQFEIMQFIGIIDKRGVEIYEGDVITNYCGDIQFVKYSGCQWIAELIKRKTSWWPAQYLYCEYMDWVVIGNIHENPKLLQKDA